LIFAEGDTLNCTLEFDYAIIGRQLHLDYKANVTRIEPLGAQLGVAARFDDFL